MKILKPLHSANPNSGRPGVRAGGSLIVLAALLASTGLAHSQTIGGIPSRSLGDLSTTPRGDGSTLLGNIGSTGADGLHLDTGEVGGIRVNFDRVIQAIDLAGDGKFNVTALGENGATLAQVAMRIVPTSGYFEVSPNFAGVNSSTYGLRLYRGEELVYESYHRPLLPFNDSTYTYQLWSPVMPKAVRVSVRPNQGLVYEYAFGLPGGSYPTVVVLENGPGPSVQCDRMQLFGDEVGGVIPTFITGLDLNFGGISERIVSGVATTIFGQEAQAGYGGVLTGAAGGGMMAFSTSTPGPLPLPDPLDIPPWDLANPPGEYGDFSSGNPSRFALASSTETEPVFLHLDLTDAATTPLALPKFRAGKSSARLQMVLPALADGTRLRFKAGGVLESVPGAATFTLGVLKFSRQGDRVYLQANPDPATMKRSPVDGLPSAADYEVDITLADGSVRTYNALPDGLRVSWEAAGVVGYVNKQASVLADGRLSLGFKPQNPLTILCPANETVSAVAMTWKLRLADNLAPGALRGLELAGSQIPSIQIQGLTTDPKNPTPGTVFSGHSVQALGNATYHRDAFGNLVVNGLSQSGADGLAVSYENGLPVELVLNEVYGLSSNGSQPVPPAGSVLDLRLFAGAGASIPEAVLQGSTLCGSYPYTFGASFPAVGATTYTVRAYLDDQMVSEHTGVPVLTDGGCGNVIPYSYPDAVTAQLINGHPAWVLKWNRHMLAEIPDQNLLNRIELIAEDGLSPAGGAKTLDFRVSGFGSWTLPPQLDRSKPAVPRPTVQLTGGKLHLTWSEALNGIPKLVHTSVLNEPWQNIGLGRPNGSGQRTAEIPTTATAGFFQVVPLKPSEGCLDFSEEEIGTPLNPWERSGWKFENGDSFDIESFAGVSALTLGSSLNVELPAAADAVEVVFHQTDGPVTFIAYDDTGEEADRKTTPAGASAEEWEGRTLNARSGHALRQLKIQVTGSKVYLKTFCVRATPIVPVAASRSCVSFRGLALGAVPNPWPLGDVTHPGVVLTARDAQGTPLPNGLISDYQATGVVGYEVNYQVELKFSEARPWVQLEFISGSGAINFQAYDDTGAALPLVSRGITGNYGDPITFQAEPRPISRVVMTSANGLTRLLKICCGPMPSPLCRDLADLTTTPGLPLADLRFTFQDASGDPVPAALRTVPGETGYDLPHDTVIEFAANQQFVELRLVVDTGGATISAEAFSSGLGTLPGLAEDTYAAGVQTLNLNLGGVDVPRLPEIRFVKVHLSAGKAILTRVCTPFQEE